MAIPNKLRLLLDVDLLEGRPMPFHMVKWIEKIDGTNWRRLVAFPPVSFDHAVTNYICDICKQRCSHENPIYTNKRFKGVDVCTRCITTAFGTMQVGPIHSLKDIAACNTN